MVKPLEALRDRHQTETAGHADTSAAAMPTLRFLTCGSVDDGKSTLIGRLLYEEQLILDDQLAALRRTGVSSSRSK